MQNSFYNRIKIAKEEREVESIYNEELNLYFAPDIIEHPYKCDGYILKNNINLLIEYKYDVCLKTKAHQAKVLVQVIYYLKQFELNGKKLPSVVLVGDINECFVLHVNDLINYLDFEGVDWTISPSNAYKYNVSMLNAIVSDDKINPFVYDINENFSFKTVAEFITNLSNNIIHKVHITPNNIESLFNYFVSNCIKDKNKFSANELVGIFMGILTNKENYYIHPNNKNKLITLDKPIAVDGKVFQSIFSHFDDNLSCKQKKELIAISDRLIENTERRFNGAFYIPSEFASYSQKMISSSLGDNWREEYVVWDCCSGLKNLTRDFIFNKLYCSTLEQNDIDLSACYNTNATSFQFDFLNDSLEKLPQSLIEHLNNNDKIIFYINPPYATACELSLYAGKSKKNVAKTRINEIMKENKVGASSQNLIAQFLYRILLIKKEFNLTNISVGCFTKPLLITASTFKKFRDLWFKEFKFDRGILFNAGHFAGVSSKWGITFEIWKEGIQEERNCFLMYIVDSKDGEVYPICSKVMYNTDGIKLASDWMKEPMKGVKTHKKSFSCFKWY